MKGTPKNHRITTDLLPRLQQEIAEMREQALELGEMLQSVKSIRNSHDDTNETSDNHKVYSE